MNGLHSGLTTCFLVAKKIMQAWLTKNKLGLSIIIKKLFKKKVG
jgi:hypothetical protein